MQLLYVGIILAIISIGWALLSLRGLLKRNESIHTKQELEKGRVLFYRPGEQAPPKQQ